MIGPEIEGIDEAAEPLRPNPRRLWTGGIATAIVAALVVVAGVFIARSILGIPVLAPAAAGSLGSATTVVYALVAAACALLATGLLHVLLLSAPRPVTFFLWITGLADLIAVAAPFAQPAPLSSKVFTAIINLIAGVAVISLLTSVAASAVRASRMTHLERSPSWPRQPENPGLPRQRPTRG